ncbi:MAG TPA: hypothetical protein PKH48_03465 [Methanofastidiosum sp.]|jgi:hypothetical protein|nr:hypothetical protein [Methanofastidiosum sp.]HOT85566.1 hypothetical protein [Methanofastidiosum sp.]HPX24822.1 hypothetical protein [Methanofastidiosum sp.]
MRRVEALPYTVEEAINKTIKELTKIGIEFHATGREIYINEDLILDKDASSERRSIGRRIKNYFKNEVEENYAILSFDDAPEGSYLVVEYTDHAAFTALAKILNLKSKSVMPEDKHVLENIDSKLERELKMINRDISGEDVSFEDEDSEDDEEEYEYINFGEKQCRVCGAVIRRVTIHDEDGNIKDGYKCINTNCLKIYIIR